MDEIGVMVSHVDEKGFVRFAPLGAITPVNCLGARVRFGDGRIGVIAAEPQPEQAHGPWPAHLYLDVGASDRASCPVKVGDAAVFEHPLAEAGGCLVAKAMDDRIGVAILIETLHRLKRTPHEVQFAFTVQEELESGGARTSAYGLDPEVALTVDVTPAGDTPRGPKADVALGKGPAVKIRDAKMLSDPRVVDWMVHRAADAHLPCQLEVLERGTSGAAVIQVSRSGVISGGLSIPCRYLHSSSEMVDLGDVENAVKLLLALLSAPVPF
jgi:endoglucanase